MHRLLRLTLILNVLVGRNICPLQQPEASRGCARAVCLTSTKGSSPTTTTRPAGRWLLTHPPHDAVYLPRPHPPWPPRRRERASKKVCGEPAVALPSDNPWANTCTAQIKSVDMVALLRSCIGCRLLTRRIQSEEMQTEAIELGGFSVLRSRRSGTLTACSAGGHGPVQHREGTAAWGAVAGGLADAS